MCRVFFFSGLSRVDVDFLLVEKKKDQEIDLWVSLPEAASSTEELLGRLGLKPGCVLSRRRPSAWKRAAMMCGFMTKCTKSIRSI